MRQRLSYRVRPDGYGGSYTSVIARYSLSSVRLPELMTASLEFVIDSGASRCVFHADLASMIDLELRAGRPEATRGISGDQEVWIHPVRLHVPGGPIQIEAAFQENLPVAGLLGMEGFFEHFVVTFDGLARECQLDRIYRA